MQCRKCGYDNPQGASACGNCGAPIASGWQIPGQDGFPNDGGEGDLPPFTEADPFSQEPMQSDAWDAKWQGAQYAAPQEDDSDSSLMGIIEWVKRGFFDVKDGIGLIRALLLLLLEGVPVVNFFVTGSIIRSGADAFEGNDRDPLSGLFDIENLKMFFRSFVFALIIGLAVSLVTFATSFVPGLGVIVGFLLPLLTMVVMVPYVYIASIRSARLSDMSPFFDFKGNIEIARRDLLGILFTSLVPSIVLALFAGLLGSVALSAFGFGASAPAATESYAGYVVSSSVSTGIDAGAFVLLGFLDIISGLISGFVSLVTFRGIGFWMAQNASDYLREQPQVRQTKQQASSQPQARRGRKQLQAQEEYPDDGQFYYTPPQYYQQSHEYQDSYDVGYQQDYQLDYQQPQQTAGASPQGGGFLGRLHRR